MDSLQRTLTALLESLPPPPVEQNQLTQLVKKALQESKNPRSSVEHSRNQWEYLLKNEIYKLAATEGQALKEADKTYYKKLGGQLDVILTFTELEACDQSFTFIVLQDLLETQTVTSCENLFTWIESRAARLTDGMVPQKGKALVLLRSLNDLLRRLSKMGSTTVLSGRILIFLSSVFPLAERSGVNLRGEYGPAWELKNKPMEEEENNMQVDEEKAKKQEDFHSIFWSLQLPFSKPPVFVSPNAFTEFKDSVTKILPVLKEAAAKERALTGNKSTSAGIKRKREADEPEAGVTEYFFPKFLTSPDLLDLELADTHFRRQILFQLLILLSHLLTYTKTAKSVWALTANKSLQMTFTLEPADAQWAQETYGKALDEMRLTTPGGRAFAETVHAILEREKNWVRWKNVNCVPGFDKQPWTAEVNGKKVGMEEATRPAREKMGEPPKDWEWELGSRNLTEVWAQGYRDMSDFEMHWTPGDIQDYVSELKKQDRLIAFNKARVTKREAAKAARLPSKPVVPAEELPSDPVDSNSPERPATKPAIPESDMPDVKSEPDSLAVAIAEDPEIVRCEAVCFLLRPNLSMMLTDRVKAKVRITWYALRVARDQYLQHFGKIGTGDIELLVQEIEKEAEKEKLQEKEMSIKDEEDHRSSSPTSPGTVLVTGGAGYIGSHVIYSLQKTRRYKVVTLDNYHNSLPAALGRIEKLSDKELSPNATEQDKETTKIAVHKCDLTKKDEIRAVFETYGKGGIWGVVHIAAYKAVGESTEIPLTYYENNVAATLYLLQVMAEYDCTRMVYSSSATVYGTPPIIPIPETTRLQADSPYGKTKVMAETIMDDLCQAEPGKWQAISLRYFNPAGAHPSGEIGEDPKGRPGNLLPLLAQMAGGRVKDPVLKVFGNDYPTHDGTCVRDYLHILDLAAGHVLALDALTSESTVFHDRPNGQFKAYNLGTGKGRSVLDIVAAMETATGKKFVTEIIGRRRGDVPDLTADPSLAEKELGFKATQNLETMCRDLWNWQTKNPEGYGAQ
ncbi:THO complex subunit 1 transcription elongation factor-domain-containing protein [Mycena floridula]|nr:THO complex subunit 1 transcription elongation factor-domain-containing protein [Mycena floridula]